jgi:hypothetical protein
VALRLSGIHDDREAFSLETEIRHQTAVFIARQTKVMEISLDPAAYGFLRAIHPTPRKICLRSLGDDP